MNIRAAVLAATASVAAVALMGCGSHHPALDTDWCTDWGGCYKAPPAGTTYPAGVLNFTCLLATQPGDAGHFEAVVTIANTGKTSTTIPVATVAVDYTNADDTVVLTQDPMPGFKPYNVPAYDTDMAGLNAPMVPATATGWQCHVTGWRPRLHGTEYKPTG